ncbi:SDR family oxidoreductase [Pseudoalteromonas mariniglutinosa]|uniref:SDR family oxidoreductase n=1 Tax=Pseudoalteromonas mariniglutinosa TaxID=206042 RepID=UPI00384C8491
MKTLIIGATGQIGKMTTQKMLQTGHQVVALARNKDKLADIHSPHLSVVEQDLENNFSHAFKDCELVIFTAGSGGGTSADKTMLIDLWAAVKAINYAKQHSVQHFIMVSSIGADAPDNIESSIKPYLVAKHMADQYLLSSGLKYTILRPGTLLNEPASKRFSFKRPHSRADAVISRENVAEALNFVATESPNDSIIVELFDGDSKLESFFH